jgi:hypothetical protein
MWLPKLGLLQPVFNILEYWEEAHSQSQVNYKQ